MCSKPTAALRTAAITGAYSPLPTQSPGERQRRDPGQVHGLTDSVAAVSVGIIRGVPMVDLPYEEDVRAIPT